MKYISGFLVFCISLLIEKVVPEYYFCYKGPQVLQDTDCPGGFFLKSPIEISCSGKYNPNGGTTAAQIGEKICSNGVDVIADPDISYFKTLQFLKTTGGGDSPDKPLSPEERECTHSKCLASWEDRNATLAAEFDDKIPPVTEEITNFQLEQNKKLFTELIDEDDSNPSPDPLAENYDANGFIRMYKLLAKSMRITIQSCDGYVAAPFYSQVLKAMMSLLDKSNNTQIDIGIDEYRRIDAALDECSQTKTGSNKGFTLIGPKCNNINKVEATEFPYKNKTKTYPYYLRPKSFRWYAPPDTKTGPKYDPIVEAAWDAVDFVHGFCFSSFRPNLVYHHIYAIAMESLFPKYPIQQRWIYPAVVKNDGQLWNNVLQTTNIKQTMKNLDACALAAYHNTPFYFRLDKPFYPMPEDPEALKAYPDNQSAKMGWKDTIEEYWTMYNENGGLLSALGDQAVCLKSVDDAEQQKVIDDLKKSC